jgi:D-threo-aldose 1-dehydrogenase
VPISIDVRRAVRKTALELPFFGSAHSAVASIILGAARPQEVTQNAAHMGAPMTLASCEYIKGQGLLAADAPVPNTAN